MNARGLPLRWVAVAVFVLSSALNALDRFLLNAVAPSVRAEFHLSNEQFGWVISAFSLTYALSAPLMGLLLDRWGLPRGASLAVGAWSLVGVLTAAVTGLPSLLACRAALGVAESAGIPAGAKSFALYLPPAERALGSAVSQVGLTLGSVAAPLLATALSPAWTWRGAFVVAGLLGFLWIPLWLFTARRIPPRSTQPAGTPQASITPRDPRLFGLVLGNMLAMVTYSLWTNWTTQYLVLNWHLSERQANQQLAWIPPVFATLGGLTGGWLALRLIHRGWPAHAARRLICLASAVLLLSTALVPYAPNPGWATAAICASFFFTVCMSVNIYALPLDLYGAASAAFTVSLLTGAYGLMQTLLSPRIGAMVDRFGFSPVCSLASLMPLLAVSVLIVTGVFRPARV